MLTTLLLAIIFAAAIVAIVKGKYNYKSYGNEKSIPLRPYGFGLLFLGLLGLGFSSYYTQDPGEAIVIKSFTGNVIGHDTSAGISFTAPWNNVISFNIRNQRVEMFGGTDKNPTEGEDGTAISAPLEGSSNADVSITLRYSINGNCIEDVYKKHKDQENLERNVVFPGLRNVTRNETQDYAPLVVKEKRAELAKNITNGLSDTWADDCILVDNIDLGAIDLDSATETAITERNGRQLEVESARADLDKAIVNAEKTKTEAQAAADSDQIVRCGATTTESVKTVAGKEIRTTVIVPKEGAACEERLNEQVLRKQYLDALQSIGEKGNMVIVVPEGQETLLQVPQPTK